MKETQWEASGIRGRCGASVSGERRDLLSQILLKSQVWQGPSIDFGYGNMEVIDDFGESSVYGAKA